MTEKTQLGYMSMQDLVSHIEANGHTNTSSVEQTAHTTIREDMWGLNEKGVYAPLGKLRLPILVGTADFSSDGYKINEGITVFDREFYDGLLPPTANDQYGSPRDILPCTWSELDRTAGNIVYLTDENRGEIGKSDLRGKRLAIMTEVDDRPDLFVREHIRKFFDLYDLTKDNSSDSDTLHLVRHSFERFS